jgi:hypothetical protein
MATAKAGRRHAAGAGHLQQLAAAYRMAVIGHLHALIGAGRARPARDLGELRLLRRTRPRC